MSGLFISLQEVGERFEIVRKTYELMHRNQTVQFGKDMVSKRETERERN